MCPSGSPSLRRSTPRFAEKALEHGAASQKMELVLGGFAIRGLRAKCLASCSEPDEPGGVFGSKLLLQLFAETLGESGAFTVGGDGDLEITALDDGAVIKMAVLDVINRIAENVEFVGFLENGFVNVTKRGGGDDQEHAVEIGWLEGFREPIDLTIANVFGEIAIEFGGDDGDASASFEKRGNF